MLKTFFLQTFGCQMNELDSEVMIGILKTRGLTQVFDEQKADILIFNTCAVRDLAERKVFGKIGLLSRLKKRPIIGITGCIASSKKEKLFEKLPNLDFVLGTNNIHNLNKIIDEVIEKRQKASIVNDLFEEEIDYKLTDRKNPISASVSIIRGCNNFCTYCIVPYTRGREVSKAPALVEEECRYLVSKGYKEITLLGQNVNSYGLDHPEWGVLFPDLLYKLDKIEGLERIRFMTSHPKDISKELIYAIRDLPSVCEFIHFPIQSGSSRILQKMNRAHTKEDYLEKVSLIRQNIKNASIGTDIIVGFPTETPQDFQDTLDIFDKVLYDVAFIFAYSPRKGTPAYRFPNDISEEVKQERLQILLKNHEDRVEEVRKSLIGEEVEVLIENVGREPGTVKGRTRCWKKVILKGDKNLIGTLQKVKISGYNNTTLLT